MNHIRLGTSQNILPYTQSQVIEADRKLNKFVLKTAQQAIHGVLLGIALSVFFLNRRRVVFYTAGFTAGLSAFEGIQ